MGSRSDESIRRREGWRFGDAAFRQNFFDHLFFAVSDVLSAMCHRKHYA